MSNDAVDKPKGKVLADVIWGTGFFSFLLSLLGAVLLADTGPKEMVVPAQIAVVFSGFASMLLFIGVATAITNTLALHKRLDLEKA